MTSPPSHHETLAAAEAHVARAAAEATSFDGVMTLLHVLATLARHAPSWMVGRLVVEIRTGHPECSLAVGTIDGANVTSLFAPLDVPASLDLVERAVAEMLPALRPLDLELLADGLRLTEGDAEAEEEASHNAPTRKAKRPEALLSRVRRR
ncbi:MAG: hypothetical protein U0183_24170 [Polyangiaceae bacterium]